MPPGGSSNPRLPVQRRHSRWSNGAQGVEPQLCELSDRRVQHSRRLVVARHESVRESAETNLRHARGTVSTRR